MKKILAVLLVLLLQVTFLAGCAAQQAEPPTASPASTGVQDDVVTLKWICVGRGMPANYEQWQAKLNRRLEQTIGVHLEMEIISWGDWEQRRKMIITANEPYDIIFTDGMDYHKDAEMGAFCDISELVQREAPGLYAFIPEQCWGACSVHGALYAVPTYKESSMTQYLVYDKALVEAAYPAYEDAHSMEAVTPVLEAMYNQLGFAPVIMSRDGLKKSLIPLKYDDLSTGLPVIGVSYQDDPGAPEVVVTLEQEDVRKDLQILNEWYCNGWINPDAAILEEAPKYRPVYIAQGWPAAAETVWGPNMGVEAAAVQLEKTVLSNATVQGSLNCISSSCEHPDKALQLLEVVNLDPMVRDMLFYGLEGDNFDYVQLDGQKRVHRNNTEWTMAGYTQGTFFTVTLQDSDEKNQWEEVRKLNESAALSPVLGFCFDPEPVLDELAACISIWDAYQPLLTTGTDISQIPDLLDAMRRSGLDRIVAEAQKQVNAWVCAG